MRFYCLPGGSTPRQPGGGYCWQSASNPSQAPIGPCSPHHAPESLLALEEGLQCFCAWNHSPRSQGFSPSKTTPRDADDVHDALKAQLMHNKSAGAPGQGAWVPVCDKYCRQQAFGNDAVRVVELDEIDERCGRMCASGRGCTCHHVLRRCSAACTTGSKLHSTVWSAPFNLLGLVNSSS